MVPEPLILRADVALRRGALDLAARLEVRPGESVALVGPNGAGKSSFLRAVAGLLRVERGRVELGGRVLDGGPEGPFVPPEERGIGVVFQDAALFPHLRVLDNVAYGPRCAGFGRREARARAATWLGRVGVEERYHASSPASLSGGQAQRVALARALAADPRALLLDEPLAAVDASARLRLRRELRSHLASFAGPRIVVAHDVTDALGLADRLAVLEGGRLVQTGTPGELVSRPRSRYVADLCGLNAFEGVGRGSTVIVGAAELTVASATEGDVLVTLHPRAVSLYSERPAGSPRNVWRAPLVGVEPLLDRARVQLGGAIPLVAEVTFASVEELRLAERSEVWVAVKATELRVTER